MNEVVRQLRLRDIGGIIVIDFIDMSNPKNRATVEEALRTELERDRTKTYVVEISPLGLVEMTRQNVTDGPREILTTKCAVCAGDGFVVSEATLALEIERQLRGLAKGSRVQAFRVAVHPRVLSLLAGPGGKRLEEIEAAARRRFFLVAAESANGHVHLDHFEVLEQGKLETLTPKAPVKEGATVELKLVEVGLYDPAAGVGKVDGWDVVVSRRREARRQEAQRHDRTRPRRRRLRGARRTPPRRRRRSRSRRRPRSRPARRLRRRRTPAPRASAEPAAEAVADAVADEEYEAAADEADEPRARSSPRSRGRRQRRRRRSARVAARAAGADARSRLRPPQPRRSRRTAPRSRS